MAEAIRFYSAKGEYGCLSNFSRHSFALDDLRWSTSEHYFQAQKFEAFEMREAIRLAPSPTAAARLGRSRAQPIVANWDDKRIDVMRRALFAKFGQNPNARAILLGTGDRELIEASPRDAFWGEGHNREGQNMLGKLLAEVRNTLRE